MRNPHICIAAMGACVLLAGCSSSYKPYTLSEIGSMKSVGMLDDGKQYVVGGPDKDKCFVIGAGNQASVTEKTVAPEEAEVPAELVTLSVAVVDAEEPAAASQDGPKFRSRRNRAKTQEVIPGSGASLTGSAEGKASLTPTSGTSLSISPSSTASSPVALSSGSKGEPIAYDRITTSRFLITMARDYYGDADFWPYIYEENRYRFAHPDKIRPGTRVAIPSLSKYGVSPSNPADKEKARKLGKEIYARFGKIY